MTYSRSLTNNLPTITNIKTETTDKKAKIKFSNKMAHYDGEPFEVKDELNVSVVPSSLNIVVSK